MLFRSAGAQLNVAEALTNLQLFMSNYETCFGYEDLLYMDKSVRQGVVCLLAEIYGGEGAQEQQHIYRGEHFSLLKLDIST